MVEIWKVGNDYLKKIKRSVFTCVPRDVGKEPFSNGSVNTRPEKNPSVYHVCLARCYGKQKNAETWVLCLIFNILTVMLVQG